MSGPAGAVATLITTDSPGCVNRHMLIDGPASPGDELDCLVEDRGAHTAIEAVSANGRRATPQAVEPRLRVPAGAR